ncbi:MAG: CvpA family protein [Pontiella sp.]
MPSGLSFVDIVVLIVIILFAWGGFQRGFAAQVASILTALCSGLFLFFAYPLLFNYFGTIFRGVEKTYLMWIILATLVILGIALYVLVSKLLAGLLVKRFSERSDGMWGLILGFIRGTLIVLLMMILMVMLDRSGTIYDKFNVKSYAGRFVCFEMVPHIQPRFTALYEGKIPEWKADLLQREEAVFEE